jgi:hypothetical protein
LLDGLRKAARLHEFVKYVLQYVFSLTDIEHTAPDESGKLRGLTSDRRSDFDVEISHRKRRRRFHRD